MSSLAPAFVEPVHGAQRVFRAVMDAMARPGSIVRLESGLAPPAPLTAAAAATALALVDYETPVWLDAPLAAAPDVVRWLRFHTGAPTTDDPSCAAFAFVSDPAAMPAFDRFALGTPDYPDRSTTLVLQVARLDGGVPLVLRGPGIAGTHTLAAQGLPANFAAGVAANRALFPCGVDVVLVCDDAVAAIPRTTRVETGGETCTSR